MQIPLRVVWSGNLPGKVIGQEEQEENGDSDEEVERVLEDLPGPQDDESQPGRETSRTEECQ